MLTCLLLLKAFNFSGVSKDACSNSVVKIVSVVTYNRHMNQTLKHLKRPRACNCRNLYNKCGGRFCVFFYRKGLYIDLLLLFLSEVVLHFMNKRY